MNREHSVRADTRPAVPEEGKGSPPPPADDPARRLARAIVGRGLATPAILFLACMKPLGFVASQLVRFAEPVLGAVARPESVDAFAGLLEDREGTERLLREIERQGGGSGEGDEGP
jgi:hypothetical protein